ncbi:polysaccharide pyruvyl transferase family protein [Pseudonocardia kujensis]|uniref:polysaccharide pyruvyl transferase family protein n=1 Tax=Pseudonocardia kujensis TaxID=1128675 RepID=UPI001E388E16|nr:polysaccharide pyruvyl transferase family protein [Pseudonocardia kujensis]MCE0768329.1 polysaccharide pyruvyl transferase family protein [Pseudonocardia kujensis]
MADDRRPLYHLVGTAGYPNYGDELIAAGWLRHLARTAPEADVWLDCPSPGTAAVLLDGLHPRARFTDTVWRLCHAAPEGGPWETAAWVRDAVADPGLAARWVAGVELLRRADVVHVIGGGYVNGIWPRHAGVLAGAVAAVEHSGGRAVATGQGLTPAADGAGPLLRSLLERFALVEVRDDASAHLLDRPDTLGLDDAFLPVAAVPTRADAPRVVLCLQSDLSDRPAEALATFVLDALRRWEADPKEVALVEGIPGQDRVVWALLEHALPGARFVPFDAVWRDGLPVAADQTWISTRFHPHLVAAAAGAGGVAVSLNGDYYPTKHRSLTALGSGWDLVTDLDATPERPTPGGFPADVLAGLRDRKAALADRVYGRRAGAGFRRTA